MLALGFGATVFGQNAETDRLWSSAQSAFEDGFWERSIRDFEEYIGQTPAEDQIALAVLFQAQARAKLEEPEAGIRLLQNYLDRAGIWRTEYLYWLGELSLKADRLDDCLKFFKQVLEAPAASVDNLTKTQDRRLDACLSASRAVAKGADAESIQSFSQQYSSIFQLSSGEPTLAIVREKVRIHLILAEALLESVGPDPAALFLDKLSAEAVTAIPDALWDRLYMELLIKRKKQETAPAVEIARKLKSISESSQLEAKLSRSISLLGRALKENGNLKEALLVFQSNLNAPVAESLRREALLNIATLLIESDQADQAAERLKQFIQQYPQDPIIDLAYLTLGELYLKIYYSLKEAQTSGSTGETKVAMNLMLDPAQAAFNTLLKKFPDSQLKGKTCLNLGWIYWERGETERPRSLEMFSQAVALLEMSKDQAVAQWKLADCYFETGHYMKAIERYQQLLQDYEYSDSIREEIFPNALYQIILASVALGDLEQAQITMNDMLLKFSNGSLSDQSLLLVGRAYTRQGRPEYGRSILELLKKRYPNSPFIGEADLAIAKTYAEEKEWSKALGLFEKWIETHAESPALAQAEYNRALCYATMNDKEQALKLFQLIDKKYPTHPITRLARLWVADHYFNERNFILAEASYRKLFETDAETSPVLRDQARMMAGRAAFALQEFDRAAVHFKTIVETGTESFRPQALFAYGDVLLRRPSTNPASPLENYAAAREVFEQIPRSYPKNPIAAAALGQIGNCYLQEAARDNSLYEKAALAYSEAIRAEVSDISTRSQAEIGLAKSYEKQSAMISSTQRKTNLIQQALDHYLNVLYGNNLKPGEVPNPLWIKEAGLAAARLLESREDWLQVTRIYKRLSALDPQSRASFERKLSDAQKRLLAGKSDLE